MYLDGAIREVNFHLVNHNTFTNEVNQSELVTKPCRTRVRRGKKSGYTRFANLRSDWWNTFRFFFF